MLESLEDIEQMSLADFLAQATSVAAATPLSQRSSPSIITVISRDEIIDSGARDLIDVLRLVPGFNFGTDVQSCLGIGFRGIWGYEGRILLLLDGHEMNEGLYSSTQFGNHFPVDQIERLEIIRGPGSATYGGYAELAVLNIITRSGDSIDGVNGSLAYGHMDGGYARRNLSLSAGRTFEQLDGLTVSASAYLGQSRRSDREFTDQSGVSFPMRNNSGASPALVNLNATWRNGEIGFLYDSYELTDRTGYGAALSRPTQLEFSGYYLKARYRFELPQAFTLTPRVRFKRQQPWSVLTSDPVARDVAYYDKTFQRLEGSLVLGWTGIEGLNALAGLEVYRDDARVDGEQVGLNSLFGDQRRVTYSNLAAFAQGIYTNPIVNVTLGARFENHSVVGSSFVPRLGLTREFGALNLKLLYSDAFRAPAVENVAINPSIDPERTRAVEIEAGYLFNDNLFASLNIFYTAIEGPIVYGYDRVTDSETYFNYARTGADGAEAVLKYRHARGSASLSYTFYTSVNNEVPLYAVPGEERMTLGFPQHKITGTGAFRLLPTLTLAPSATLQSERFAYTSLGSDGAAQLSRMAPSVLLDFFVTWRPENFSGLTMQAGVHNILDAEYAFAQPYDGGQAPLPGMGREFGLRIGFDH